jgi:SAM-dependent methyltransferase
MCSAGGGSSGGAFSTPSLSCMTPPGRAIPPRWSTPFAHAAIGPGAAVLEIGCGTGQLTRKLAGRALSLTAIDIGVAMVAAAQRNITDPTARLQVASFEDLADTGPFDLIVAATAFHWVDPGVGLAKAARLLRPGGWLALLTTGERSPEPLGRAAGAVDEIQPPEREMGRPAGLAASAAGNHPVRRDGRSEPRQGTAASSGDGPGRRTHPRHVPQLQQAGPGRLHRRPSALPPVGSEETSLSTYWIDRAICELRRRHERGDDGMVQGGNATTLIPQGSDVVAASDYELFDDECMPVNDFLDVLLAWRSEVLKVRDAEHLQIPQTYRRNPYPE